MRPLRCTSLVLLVLLATQPEVCPAPAAGSKPAAAPAKRRNVLLLTVESLRIDRLGCYKAGQDKTPSIDALAASGVRFERITSSRTLGSSPTVSIQ